ncbi:MAG: hypothetical protein H7A51_07715 [Akkermansiaceae bacterium]|nr:hypothetical protein [Akkermansiaceae bacterium]
MNKIIINTNYLDTRAGDHPSPDAENNNALSHSNPELSEDVVRVKELHSELNKLAKKTLLLASEAGRILCRLKEDTPHAQWESYVQKELGIHPRSASNYMRVWTQLSHWETSGEFLKSESVSEMGMREALDFFTEQEESATTKSERPSPKVPVKRRAAPQPHEFFSLADESKISFKKIRWKEGLISKDCLETSLSKLTSKDETPRETKTLARQQRFVAEIAASINRCAGMTRPEVATKTAQAALEIVSKMISESEKPSQQQ